MKTELMGVEVMRGPEGCLYLLGGLGMGKKGNGVIDPEELLEGHVGKTVHIVVEDA